MRITLTKTLAAQPAGTQLHVPDTIGDRLVKRGLATNGNADKPAPETNPAPKAPTTSTRKTTTKRAPKGQPKGGGDSPSP